MNNLKNKKTKKREKIKNCCKIKINKKTKKCIRKKDNKIFSLPRRFSRRQCLKFKKSKKNHGFSVRSSCALYKYC